MSTAAAIVVQDRRIFGLFAAQRASDQVLHVSATDAVAAICQEVVRLRALLPAEGATRLTIFCHGVSQRTGFELALGAGLSVANLHEVRPLTGCGFRKIVVKACGPVPPDDGRGPRRIGGDALTRERLAAAHEFYGRLARTCNTEVIAAEQWQLTVMGRTGRMRSTPWTGVRWSYQPGGERRGILPQEE